MAKKAKEEKIVAENTATVEEVEVTPEMLQEIMGGGTNEMFSYGLAEKLLMTDLEERTFYIDGIITPDIFREVTMFIVKANGIDYGLPVNERIPIKIVINSDGGSVLDGLGLIDCIRTSETPVVTIAMGYCYSMAFNVFVAGHTRIALPNATFLCHDGETGIRNSTTKTKDTMKFYEKLDDRLDKMIASRSKLTIKHLDDIKRQENYWFADEGKELGFVDYIIGEDVVLGELFSYEENNECDCDCCHKS